MVTNVNTFCRFTQITPNSREATCYSFIMTSARAYRADIKGKMVTFTYLGINTVPFEQVTAVIVIPFTKDGKLVAVNLHHRGLDLPGGHVESYEKTPEETAHREVMEEACMTIKNLHPIELIQSDYFDTPSYMLLYAAFVDEMQEFISSSEASERIVTTPEEFLEHYEAGDKVLMGQAIKRAWELICD